MNNEVFFTIGIPTFLREESLADLLIQISKVKPPKSCEVLIISNGPELDLKNCVSLLEESGYFVNVIQNKRNCGGQENVIRIYENALGEYVWFLGDDDRLYADSIVEVIDCLNNNPCDCLIFDADARDHPIITLKQGYYDLSIILGGVIPLRKLMFAPLAVLRSECISRALPLARLNLGCFTPQLLLIIYGNVKNCYYLKRKIITCEEVAAIDRDQRLSLLPVFLGIGYLPKVNVSKPLKRKLLKLLRCEWFHFLKPSRVIAAFMIAKIQGRPESVMAFSAAGFRNYPLWLAVFFPLILFVATAMPRNISCFLLDIVGNRILKKGVKFDKYFSTDRV